MTPDDERRAAAVPGVPVADRLRALADAPWSERGDAATQAALREGADAVERLAAVARGAQYREREARNEVAMLRARLDGERERCARLCDAAAARWRSHRDVDYAARDKLRARGKEAAALAAEIRGVREDARAEWDALHDVLAASVGALDGVGASGDLAALARREAGPVTRRQWRGCSRCGQCFLLADTEAMPGHGVTVDGVDRACGTKGDGR